MFNPLFSSMVALQKRGKDGNVLGLGQLQLQSPTASCVTVTNSAGIPRFAA
jgi:hypothetical protein